MKKIPALLVGIIFSTQMLWAAQKISVQDTVDVKPEEGQPNQPVSALGEDLPQVKAPDVLDDPDAANEKISHLGASIKLNREGINEGIKMTIRVLYAARAKADSKWKGIFSGVQNSFLRSQIAWPKAGFDFNACDEGVLAFVIRGDRTIHLCSALAYGFGSADYFAQVFVHESSHINGYFNECDATRIEVNAMRLAGHDLAFKNGYMERCGIN